MDTRRPKIVLMGLLAALGAGCSADRGYQSAVVPASRPVSAVPAAAPADRFTRGLEEAGPGEAFVVSEGPGGRALNVVVVRDYHAASGRLCRRLRVEGADRVACRDAVGVWRLLPPLTNRALPALAAGQTAVAGP